MNLNRRDFLRLATTGLATGALQPYSTARAAGPFSASRIKALAFDAFPIFDPRSVFALAEQLFPGNGVELSNEWRTRQFEYTWLRVATQRYVDFWQVTGDALEFAALKLKTPLGAQERNRLMNAYLELRLWPDVMPVLSSLKKLGYRLTLLSNFTPAMLDSNLKRNSLNDLIDKALSTDQVKTYKPDPRAYALGIDSLKLDKEEVLFVAFAGWDAAGAKLFGYPTFWMNRQKLPNEKLGATPDGTGESMKDLLQFLR